MQCKIETIIRIDVPYMVLVLCSLVAVALQISFEIYANISGLIRFYFHLKHQKTLVYVIFSADVEAN